MKKCNCNRKSVCAFGGHESNTPHSTPPTIARGQRRVSSREPQTTNHNEFTTELFYFNEKFNESAQLGGNKSLEGC